MPNQERLRYIDIAKGIGIFLVALGHVRTSVALHDAIFLFHMPLFFLLSGMVFKREEDWWPCMKKKFVHLLLPYFFFMAMFVPLRMVAEKLCTGEFPAFRLSMLGLSYFDKPLWFVFALFGVIGIMRTLLTFVRCKYVVLGGIVALSMLGYILLTQKIELPFHISRALFVLPFFALGLLIRRMQDIKWFSIIDFLFFGFGLWGLGQGHVALDTLKLQVDGNPLFVYLPAIGGAMAILSLSLLCDRNVLIKVNRGGVNGYARACHTSVATHSIFSQHTIHSLC